MWQVKFRSSALPVDHGNEQLKYLSHLRRKATLSLYIPLLCVMVPNPLEDLNDIIRFAHTTGIDFVEIYNGLYILRDHYRRNPDISSRWRVTRIIKLKKKIGLKHEFIVACLQCDGVGNDQYLCLERMSGIGSGSGLGFSISAASDRFFSEEDPANNPENTQLMSLVLDTPGIQMTLPVLLILASSIHNIARRYKPFSANCYWFADAMTNAMRQRHGFVINWEQEQSQNWAARTKRKLNSLIFRKSTATEQQMNDIYDRLTTAQNCFFDLEQPFV